MVKVTVTKIWWNFDYSGGGESVTWDLILVQPGQPAIAAGASIALHAVGGLSTPGEHKAGVHSFRDEVGNNVPVSVGGRWIPAVFKKMSSVTFVLSTTNDQIASAISRVEAWA